MPEPKTCPVCETEYLKTVEMGYTVYYDGNGRQVSYCPGCSEPLATIEMVFMPEPEMEEVNA